MTLDFLRLLSFHIADGDQPPGAYLLDGNGSSNGHKGLTSAKSGMAPVLNSVSEVRAPNPETAGFYLDSALDVINARDEGGGTAAGHIVFTLHVYQYSIDKTGKGGEYNIHKHKVKSIEFRFNQFTYLLARNVIQSRLRLHVYFLHGESIRG